MAGVEWATKETVLPEKDLHMSNTKAGPNGTLSFWMHQPRPDGVSPEEWDQITHHRWDRIFRA
jgi:hypothetical protein